MAANQLVVRYVPPIDAEDEAHNYYIKVLTAALQATVTSDGPFELRANELYMVQSRAMKELSLKRKIDIYWTMSSKERESSLLPIRTPLLNGFLGYRVFMIRS